MDILETYKNNEEFRIYVDHYADGRGIEPEEALKHLVVKIVYGMYYSDKINK